MLQFSFLPYFPSDDLDMKEEVRWTKQFNVAKAGSAIPVKFSVGWIGLGVRKKLRRLSTVGCCAVTRRTC